MNYVRQMGVSVISLQLVGKSFWSEWSTFHPNNSFYNPWNRRLEGVKYEIPALRLTRVFIFFD